MKEKQYEYILEPLNESGSAFVVRKMNGIKITEEYTISINNQGYRICTCPGFTGHGHCKHMSMKPSYFMIELCNLIDELYHTRIKHPRRSTLTKDH